MSAQKERQLQDLMRETNVAESDLEESFIKGSGKGGQKINKTSSCVYLLHKPSGMEVKCQRYREQSLNRYEARRMLCERLKEKLEGLKSERTAQIEKIRRQKRRKTKRQKAKMVDDKRHKSIIKSRRKKASIE